MRKIISFLQTRPQKRRANKDTSNYTTKNCKQIVQNGEFITSTDALVCSEINKNAKFAFVGSQDEFSNTENLLSQQVDFKQILAEGNDYKELFKNILEIIDDEDEIIIDITHSSRDSVFAAMLSSLIHRLRFNQKLILIHAKPTENGYEFVRLNQYIDIIEYSFALLSFKQYIKVPNLSIDDDFYRNLKRFSEAFLSNQIDSCRKIYPKLKESLETEKEESLLFLSEFIDDILDELSFFDEITNQTPRYQIYFNVAVFLHKKGYFLNSSQFLIEAIPCYVFDCLKSQILGEDIEFSQGISDICGEFLKYTGNKSTFKLGINFQKFCKVSDIRWSISNIRNRLTHIDIDFNHNLENELENLLYSFKKNIITNDILRKQITEQDFTKNQFIKFLKRYKTDRDNQKAVLENLKMILNV
ncbi:TM1812 family CRISPR-associated protein [Campylobacter geochelonis]|uniref:TM1812 family CRISPR-associated protein n=1 Tax=Campylobacter geochelonis TaxID=1780362 RepID=UPI0007707C6A|nr:TM1812 family CRISPR-associated protein [Campylobacter geochelonis]CZE46261.1 Uncharacterised protein [Campylobacter geochelonis]